MELCPICKENIIYILTNKDAYKVICPRCGEYIITGSALACLKTSNLTDRQRANVSGWLSENRQFEINSYNLDVFSQIKTPSFHERADKILLAFERMTEYAGHFLPIDAALLSFGYCLNLDELKEILDFLKDAKRIYLQHNGDYSKCKIIAGGWEHLEKLNKVNADSQQGFVAMWFDKDMMKIYDKAISKGILDAGYEPRLVSDREHNDKIDDEIIAQIRRSRFVLADFTGHRGGVYYEAGFAKGLGIEVSWTCKEDDIKNLHFDIR